MKAVALGLLCLGVFAWAGCAPYASRPIGGGADRICEWVRARVADGSMPLHDALRWYGRCAPFEVPSP